MNQAIAAGELWDIFTKECLLTNARPTAGAWDSWLKKAKAFQPKPLQMAVAVHLAVNQSALIDSLLGRSRGRTSSNRPS